MIKIKKYKNRKFYCYNFNKYLNLTDIATLIKNNKEIIIIDHYNNDITLNVLKEIIPKCDIIYNEVLNIIKNYYNIPIKLDGSINND